VIEHVGNEEKQIAFLMELNRVCRKLYFTTPNRCFPFEVYTRTPFIHWLPKKVFDRIMIGLGKEWITGDNLHLISCSKLERIMKKAGITGYVIHRNRFCGFTMDFSVVKA